MGRFFFRRVDDFLPLAGEPVRVAPELVVEGDSLQENAGILLLRYEQS